MCIFILCRNVIYNYIRLCQIFVLYYIYYIYIYIYIYILKGCIYMYIYIAHYYANIIYCSK